MAFKNFSKSTFSIIERNLTSLRVTKLDRLQQFDEMGYSLQWKVIGPFPTNFRLLYQSDSKLEQFGEKNQAILKFPRNRHFLQLHRICKFSTFRCNPIRFHQSDRSSDARNCNVRRNLSKSFFFLKWHRKGPVSRICWNPTLFNTRKAFDFFKKN